jgi:hypothetical protein
VTNTLFILQQRDPPLVPSPGRLHDKGNDLRAGHSPSSLRCRGQNARRSDGRLSCRFMAKGLGARLTLEIRGRNGMFPTSHILCAVFLVGFEIWSNYLSTVYFKAPTFCIGSRGKMRNSNLQPNRRSTRRLCETSRGPRSVLVLTRCVSRHFSHFLLAKGRLRSECGSHG